MVAVLKIADFLAERIGNAPAGAVLVHKEMEPSFLKELLEKRVEELEKGKIINENTGKVSPENEIVFIKNVIKRLDK